MLEIVKQLPIGKIIDVSVSLMKFFSPVCIYIIKIDGKYLVHWHKDWGAILFLAWPSPICLTDRLAMAGFKERHKSLSGDVLSIVKLPGSKLSFKRSGSDYNSRKIYFFRMYYVSINPTKTLLGKVKSPKFPYVLMSLEEMRNAEITYKKNKDVIDHISSIVDHIEKLENGILLS